MTSTATTIRGPGTARNSSEAMGSGPNEAATKLAEAIDDFLGDLEKKFKGISDEILTKCEWEDQHSRPARPCHCTESGGFIYLQRSYLTDNGRGCG